MIWSGYKLHIRLEIGWLNAAAVLGLKEWLR
jgi:hypothetical protein